MKKLIKAEVINQLKTKKGYSWVLFFVMGIQFYCAAQQKETVLKKNNPFGTMWLKDNLYIDITPISNVNYREYEYYMYNKIKYNFTEFDSLINSLPYFGYDRIWYEKNFVFTPNPDSAKYKIDLRRYQSDTSHPSYLNYLRNPQYNYYPVLNITNQVAEAYCKWRTDIVMLYYASNKKLSERALFHKKIKYRLPTKEEWEYAVTHLPIKFSFNENISFSGKGSVTQSFSDADLGKHNSLAGKKFILNDVSEMVSEKFVAKGRNWNDSNSWNNINFTTSYEDTSTWLTFRCICEVED